MHGSSTDHQSLEAQQDALRQAGAERVFTDKFSRTRDDRPGFASLVDYVRAGDTVVVVALDRLGRSLSSVIRTIEQLTTARVLLRSLREGIDYSTPTGRMLAGIFAALAEYERELMHERAAAARHADGGGCRTRPVGVGAALVELCGDLTSIGNHLMELTQPHGPCSA